MSIRHDYKSASTGQRRLGVRRYGLLVMTLVLMGLFSGLLASIRGDRTQSPSVAAATPATPAQPPATPAQPPATPAQPPAALPPSRAVAASVAEPGPVKPKYDFYTELPKRHISIQGEIVNPRSAHPVSPSRMQPAAAPRKPAKARQNTTNPAVATTASGAKRNVEPANAKAATAKPTTVKSANADSTNTKAATAKPTTVKSANADSTNTKAATAKPTTVKSANADSTNAKAANAKSTASARSANANSANAESTNAKAATAKSTASAKPANAKAENSESATAKATTAKSATAKSANTKPESTTTPTRATRAAQPPRPLANNGSKAGQDRVIPWLE